jgi:hypothetical protein
MNYAFLIITYGINNLDNCIQSIKNIYPNCKICIIDNNISGISNIQQKYNNIFYQKNDLNNFELGAIWLATKTWIDIDKFIIFHNSFELIKELPEYIFINDYTPLWTACVTKYSPVIPWVEEKLNSLNIKINYNKPWKSICGLCCSIDTTILKNLINKNCDKIYALNKNEAVGTEILFGYLIHEYLNIKSNALHKYPIYTYIHKKENWIWIEKILEGQGSNNYNIINIDFTPFNKLPLTNNLNKNIQILLKFYESNDELSNNLLNTYPKCIECKNIKSELSIIRHRLFTKKYFKDIYYKEYNEIMSNPNYIF